MSEKKPHSRTGESLENFLITAEALDNMEKPVTDWEAGFLENILRSLRSGRRLTDKQGSVLERMAGKYLDEMGPPVRWRVE